MSTIKKNRSPRWFQWIDGENAGKIVKLVDIDTESGETFYFFDDGESCNKEFVSRMTCKPSDLKNKFMVEVESDNPKNGWRFKTIETSKMEVGDHEFIQAPPIEDIMNVGEKNHETGEYSLSDSQLGKKKLLPPEKYNYDYSEKNGDLPGFDWFYDEGESKEDFIEQEAVKDVPAIISDKEPVKVVQEVNQKQCIVYVDDESDKMTEDEKAISILVKKTKKHDTEIVLSIHMNLPSKSIYSIAKDEFDNGEELFIKEVVKSLTNDEIIKAIGEGLKEAYSNNE